MIIGASKAWVAAMPSKTIAAVLAPIWPGFPVKVTIANDVKPPSKDTKAIVSISNRIVFVFMSCYIMAYLVLNLSASRVHL